MRKVLKYFTFALFLCFILLGTTIVKAENFYEAEYIDDMWITRDRAPAHWYQKARVFRQKSNNKESYCLDPFAIFDGNGFYSSSTSYNSLSSEVQRKIKLAAYYGYGYSGHTDKKWYAITQVLIWRYASSGRFFFTDGLDGPEISTYNNELNELDNLVSRHYTVPSFSNNTIKVNYGEELVLTDTNQVLGNYTVLSDLYTAKSGNNLVIKGNSIGEHTIKLYKNSNNIGTPMFYASSTSQDMMIRGSVDNVNTSLKVIVEGGTITIHKVDYDNGTCTPQGEASLDGAIYEIYNESGEIVDTVTISNCSAKTKELPFGNYIIKELAPGEGYVKDEKEHLVTLDNNHKDEVINLTNKVIERKVHIQKLYGNKDLEDYKVEPNITFGIYDKNNIELFQVITNKSGETTFTLPYGSYIIKQLTTTKDYEKVNDIYLTINNDSDKRITYILKNNYIGEEIVEVPDTLSNAYSFSFIDFLFMGIYNDEKKYCVT